MHFVDTHKVFRIYQRNFCRGAKQGSWMSQCLHYLFADLAVLSLAYTSYKKFIIYH